MVKFAIQSHVPRTDLYTDLIHLTGRCVSSTDGPHLVLGPRFLEEKFNFSPSIFYRNELFGSQSLVSSFRFENLEV